MRVRAQMEIILTSEPEALLFWADADGLETGRIEGYNWTGKAWFDCHVVDVLTTVFGVPLCEHYALKPYR